MKFVALVAIRFSNSSSTVKVFITIFWINFGAQSIEHCFKLITGFAVLPDSFGFSLEEEKSPRREIQTHFFFWTSDHLSSPCGVRRWPPLSCVEAPVFIIKPKHRSIIAPSDAENILEATLAYSDKALLTLASLPLFLNLFKRSTFSAIFSIDSEG